MTRVYQPVALQTGLHLILNEAASHHVSRVLRMGVGDPLILFNGEGGEYAATITRVDKKNVIVDVQGFTDKEAESALHLTLAQGMARGEKMDFIIQKACELGVNVIQPLVTSRCNVHLSGERESKRVAHWQAVIQSACEQCGRNRLPVVAAPLSLEKWLPTVNAEHRYVLTPWEKQAVLPAKKHGASAAILIGPEGGLSDDEVTLAIKHQFESLQLGPRILRTETATVVGLSVMQAWMGDLVS